MAKSVPPPSEPRRLPVWQIVAVLAAIAFLVGMTVIMADKGMRDSLAHSIDHEWFGE